MLMAALLLLGSAFITSVIGVKLAGYWARSLRMIDAPGERKVHTIPTPRNGGIGIFAGLGLPILAGLAVACWLPADSLTWLGHSVTIHLAGVRYHAGLALLLLGCTLGIHLVGLWDDRKNLSPYTKLFLQLLLAASLVIGGEGLAPGGFRTLSLLDQWGWGGTLLSGLITVLWLTALTNALNFLDNMDGLSAGVATIAAACLLLYVILQGQWFVAGLLLLLIGSCLGFLVFNFPPAKIFMGDGGSTVLGFFLAALTIRTTYVTTGDRHWYGVLVPLIVMAVPLYDLTIVTVVRLARGKSPMQGDTNHFSHRLVRQGFSKRNAVLIIYGVTAALGISAPLLVNATALTAVLIGIQTLALLVVIGVLERVGEHTR